MKYILFFVMLIAYGQANSQQIDANGWTILNSANADKILYVSSSDGNDATGAVYTSSDTQVFANPINPTAIQAFKTIDAAINEISNNGEAAWILLKRGDTFFEPLTLKNGKSSTQPIVYSSYGTSNEIPLLKTGDDHAVDFCCGKDLTHIWVIGISFYAHFRNPDDADFVSANGAHGFRIWATNTATIDDILLEGCTFRFYDSNVILSASTATNGNIRMRRNVISDNYSVMAHSQGMFATNATHVTLEDNIFDHNGWYKQSINSDNSRVDGQANFFNHNTYFANMHDVLFQENSFYRSSSIGTKWTANSGEASSTNLDIINNFYHDGEIGISIGGNTSAPAKRFKNVQVTGNVYSDIGRSQPTNRNLGWGIEINDWENGDCMNNYIIHNTNSNVTNGRAIMFTGQNKDVTISQNIIYNFAKGEAFRINDMSGDNINITDNKVMLASSNGEAFIESDDVHNVFSNNQYYIPSENFRFRISGGFIDEEEWVDRTNETGLIFEDPNFPDPTRSLDRYVTEILNLQGLDEFYTELRKMNHLNWKTEYTGKEISNWIKAGFAQTPLSTTENNLIANKLQLFPNPANDVITLSFNGSSPKTATIFSITGQQLQQQNIISNQEISISSLANGIYFLELYDNTTKTRISKKFIKK